MSHCEHTVLNRRSTVHSTNFEELFLNSHDINMDHLYTIIGYIGCNSLYTKTSEYISPQKVTGHLVHQLAY